MFLCDVWLAAIGVDTQLEVLIGSFVGHAYWGLDGRNVAFEIDVAHETLSVTDERPSH